MHLEAEIKLNSEMHWEARIELVWRYILRPRLSSSEMHLEAGDLVELQDALGGHDRASLEMHLEAVIKRIWRYTWRP
jgi:hypothetical protein